MCIGNVCEYIIDLYVNSLLVGLGRRRFIKVSARFVKEFPFILQANIIYQLKALFTWTTKYQYIYSFHHLFRFDFIDSLDNNSSIEPIDSLM